MTDNHTIGCWIDSSSFSRIDWLKYNCYNFNNLLTMARQMCMYCVCDTFWLHVPVTYHGDDLLSFVSFHSFFFVLYIIIIIINCLYNSITIFNNSSGSCIISIIIFLIRHRVNTGWRKMYRRSPGWSLEDINFVPICACRDSCQWWRHNVCAPCHNTVLENAVLDGNDEMSDRSCQFKPSLLSLLSLMLLSLLSSSFYYYH